ncbi:MAG TPA: DUF6541 family protein [Humibacter sp.]|nr:DUF6541 family protein [Humibacter sp.]
MAVLLVPGIPVAVALGARGITFVAVSVTSSVSAVAASALAAPYLHIPWRPWTPLVVALPISLLGWLLRRWWLRRIAPARTPEWGRPLVASAIGIVVAGVVIGASLLQGIHSPEAIAQTPDVTFHLNSVRQILDTGDASTLAMNVASRAVTTVFYPNAWHAIVASAVQLTGAPLVVAANASTFVICCFVWPVGCVFLSRQLFGTAALPQILTGILSAAFAAFPLLMVEYGVLYPYLLAIALVPIAFGLLVAALGKADREGLERPAQWLVLAWAFVGIAVAQPSGVMTIAALAFPLTAQVLIERLRRGRRPVRRRVLAVVLFAIGWALIAIAWIKISAITGSNYTVPYETIWHALGEALLNAPLQRPAAIAASVLMLVGIAVAIAYRRHAWLVGSWLVSVVMYMIVAGWYVGKLRSTVVGSYYNTSSRLASVLVLLAVPLAVLGATFLLRWLQRLLRRVPHTPWLPAAASAVLIVALIPLTQGSSIAAVRNVIAATYRFGGNSALLSPDERAMFDIVAAKTPEDAVIAGNPWNGSALVYAYTDRRALFPHIRGSWTPDQLLLARGFASATPQVCAAVERLGVSYVLDFGDRYLTPGNPRTRQYPGLDHLATSPALTLVAQHGTAKLYKVTRCPSN